MTYLRTCENGDRFRQKGIQIDSARESGLGLADKYSSPDVYINEETDTCWHPGWPIWCFRTDMQWSHEKVDLLLKL